MIKFGPRKPKDEPRHPTTFSKGDTFKNYDTYYLVTSHGRAVELSPFAHIVPLDFFGSAVRVTPMNITLTEE